MKLKKNLGFFTRFFLVMKGKNDARKNIICPEKIITAH